MFAFSPPATRFGEGNVFTSTCQEFCPQGGVHGGGMHGRGTCKVGCAWQGACMVGGMHGGGMCSGGTCMVRVCVVRMPPPSPPSQHYEMRPMSGWYASYWNAFLYNVVLVQSVANISGMLLMEKKVVTRVKSDHISVCGEGGVVYVCQTCILPLFLASFIKNFK